jgi:hypothetical protein
MIARRHALRRIRTDEEATGEIVILNATKDLA